MEHSDRCGKNAPQIAYSQVLKILHTDILLAKRTYSNITICQSRVARWRNQIGAVLGVQISLPLNLEGPVSSFLGLLSGLLMLAGLLAACKKTLLSLLGEAATEGNKSVIDSSQLGTLLWFLWSGHWPHFCTGKSTDLPMGHRSSTSPSFVRHVLIAMQIS